MDALGQCLEASGHAHQVVGHPTLFEAVFTDKPMADYRDVQGSDRAKATRFNELLRENGIFKGAGKSYVSLALTDEDLELTAQAFNTAAEGLHDG
jgi:glutamate-1-semialdehyde 2,1-aminomutase